MTSSRRLTIVLALAVAALSLSGCMTLGLTSYSAEPIDARVVDAQTGQPLDGVNVVARWQLEGGLEGGNNEGQMMVMEAVTDADGRFHLPGWGPKHIPFGLVGVDSNAHLADIDPGLFLFKSGYVYLDLRNQKTLAQIEDDPHLRTSDWTGKTIKMRQFVGSVQAYGSQLAYFSAYVRTATADERNYCEWVHLPLFIGTMKRETAILEERGVYTDTYYASLLANEEQLKRHCHRSVREFIKEQVP